MEMNNTLFFSNNSVVGITIILLTISFLILAKNSNSKSSKENPTPPGPKPWPILGNLPHLTKDLHISITELAKQYGPLISLKLGTQVLVVGSSPEVAAEILGTQDRLLSSRHILKACPHDTFTLERYSLVASPNCSENWKSLRALVRTELFASSKSMLRELKMSEMVRFLTSKQGEVVNIRDVVFSVVCNILSNLFFSKDFIRLDDQGICDNKYKFIVDRMLELATTPNVAEFYPIFARLDPQGIRKNIKNLIAEMCGLWKNIVNERRERLIVRNSSPPAPRDLLDVLLGNEFVDEQINILINELLTAGTDTTTTTIEWAMAELLRNREVLNKLSEELRREIKRDSIKESEVHQLPYLRACVKETLRLHPPVPFLLPHHASESCQVMNYTIPKGSMVLVNAYGIGRNPKIWDDPLVFKPERFIGSNLDFKGNHYEFLPFGSGRRICPGMPLASVEVHLVLAALVNCFDWCLVSCENPEMLDMTEKFGLTLQKEQPLLATPKPKTNSII